MFALNTSINGSIVGQYYSTMTIDAEFEGSNFEGPR